jgi:hypothetical protein
MPKPLGLFNTNRLIRTANNTNCLGFESRVSRSQDNRGKGGKVQCLATRESWPGIVLFGGVFYNQYYVKGIISEIGYDFFKLVYSKDTTLLEVLDGSFSTDCNNIFYPVEIRYQEWNEQAYQSQN